MTNGTSELAQARLAKHMQQMRKDHAILKQRIASDEKRIEALRQELTQIAAPDRVDARNELRNAIGIIICALMLGSGFIFFAEFSLERIGFEWDPRKLYLAGFIFWLGTVVATHVYLSNRKVKFSELPASFRILPLVLIIIGVVVLAVARGMGSFTVGASTTTLNDLAKIAQWSGLIAQVTLSLGLDLSSGVVGWAGVKKFNWARPIWQRYTELESLLQQVSALSDTVAAITAELGISPIDPGNGEPAGAPTSRVFEGAEI